MYSESDLEAAVAAGAISPEAAAALRNHVAAARRLPAVDEEHFRLVTGFNDIFVAIAAAILLVAIGWIGNSIPPRIEGGGPSFWGPVLVAATAWGLAEFFTLRRRMALPSILLLLAFAGGAFGGTAILVTQALGEEALRNNHPLQMTVLAVAAAVTVGATFLHWRRFRVPITIAAGAAAAVGVALGLLAAAIGDVPALETMLLGFALLLGIGVFLFAMWWDASDPRRETRRSDVAFWLHLLSAPLIVHPVFTLLGLNSGEATPIEALVVVLVYLGLGLTALAIDRRALLVSSLAYVLWALSDLFERFGAVELNFALTAFLIGSALLLLSAFWHGARRAVVTRLPAALQGKLPVLDRTLAAA